MVNAMAKKVLLLTIHALAADEDINPLSFQSLESLSYMINLDRDYLMMCGENQSQQRKRINHASQLVFSPHNVEHNGGFKSQNSAEIFYPSVFAATGYIYKHEDLI